MSQAARDFGAQFVMIYQDNTPGLLTSTAERLGKITIGSELGWGEAVSEIGVSMAKQGILAAAIRQGQLRGEIPPNSHFPAEEQVLVDNSDLSCYVLSPFAGHFEPILDCGVRLSENQILGYLHDFDRIDEDPLPIRAPHDGYLLCTAWRAQTFQGEVVAVVSKKRDWPK
ncbi:MAG: succinylglutamate desuccinylase/aspartoacylase family protein [Planctomycetota bacterium]|nr:succinylglutamate desuccinylase/aspartoacylase family protein [Planctomycetota bacterium]